MPDFGLPEVEAVMAVTLIRQRHRRALLATCTIAALLATILVVRSNQSAQATSAGSPYDVPPVVDVNPDPGIVETTMVADETTVDIGGVTAHAYTYNGTIPGPQFQLTPGQRVIVHFENHLDSEPTAIHWHGIELSNPSDGTPLTQNQVPPGGNFLYDFVAPRPGVYWYHPHHEFSTNQVFKGLYGAIIITDPNEPELVGNGTLPSAANTRALALSDITVCKAPGSNDTDTYDDSLPWVGGGPLPEQAPSWPSTLCEQHPLDNHGEELPGPLAAGDVPNIQKHSAGRVNEGQTVLTNGVNVGGRAGTPEAPGALAPGASVLDVQPGQGLRLQIGNSATTRFFRLRLTDSQGSDIPLVRVGGEGGLLDDAVLDGTAAGGFDFDYEEGEILLDPGDRTDVVIAFPSAASGVATLWTEDFRRTGGGDGAGGWTNTPTVPVAHFNVTGLPVAPAYTIGAGTPLRSATGDTVEALPAASGHLLDPAEFPTPGLGLPNEDIRLTAGSGGGTPGAASIDGVQGTHDFTVDYTAQPHQGSSRWALIGDTLELTVTNATFAHHPFHLHGFSIQPLSFTDCIDFDGNPLVDFNFPHEFMDNLNIPGRCTLTLRVRLDDRPFPDGTPGGGLGRWMFHCHIFFHHHQGMVSELVVVRPEVTITNVDPPGSLYPVGTAAVTVDADVLGGIAPTFDWDDNAVTTVGVHTSGAQYTSSHTFNQAGVYTIVATVEKNGFSDSDSTTVVVFDRSAGYVTGGGTINSPPGAYPADPSLTGEASFGFVCKYKKKGTVPAGQTEFSFKAGDFKFNSTSYQWLVVAGAKTQYKGAGTVNGTGNYGFLVTAIDGQLSGGGGVDRFRLKIWNKDNGDAVVYDNVLGASEDIDIANPQAISSGSVVIHKKA